MTNALLLGSLSPVTQGIRKEALFFMSGPSNNLEQTDQITSRDPPFHVRSV